MKFRPGPADMVIVRNGKNIATVLPKPVLDRIHRYAREGREPRVRYGPNDCLLLASAHGQLPVVVLKSSVQEFPQIRSAALVEWLRVSKRKG